MKKALIIGASRGLGLGLVEEHLRRDWHVTATQRNHSQELHKLADEFSDRLVIDHLDIKDQGQQHELVQRNSGQTFDLLFLNAGIMLGWGQPLTKVSDADIADKFLTNAIAPVRAADNFLDNVRTGGMIAFMSSVLGSVSANKDGRGELYRASKAALNSLVLSFCARNADKNITVLILHPGVVRTDMGGPHAPLDVKTSVTGIANVIEQRWGQKEPVFVDYRNQVIPW